MIQPRLLRLKDAAGYCGVSVTFWRALVKAGGAPAPISIDGRIEVWDRAALDRWIDSLGRGGVSGFAGVD